ARQRAGQGLRRAARAAPLVRGRPAPVPVAGARHLPDPGREHLRPAAGPLSGQLRRPGPVRLDGPAPVAPRRGLLGGTAAGVERPAAVARLRGQALRRGRLPGGAAAGRLRRGPRPLLSRPVPAPGGAGAAAGLAVVPGLLPVGGAAAGLAARRGPGALAGAAGLRGVVAGGGGLVRGPAARPGPGPAVRGDGVVLVPALPRLVAPLVRA